MKWMNAVECEDCWCVRGWCGRSGQVKVKDKGGRPQIAKIETREKKKILYISRTYKNTSIGIVCVCVSFSKRTYLLFCNTSEKERRVYNS